MLQFRLRSLLVLMFVTCLALGYWTDAARRQREAVAAIEAASGSVTYRQTMRTYDPALDGDDPFEPSPNGTTATHVKEWLKDQAYDLLGHDYFCGVEDVRMDRWTDVTPALGRLADLPGLEGLTLPFALDRDLRAIGMASGMRVLDLSGSGLTDEGLQHLGRLHRLARLNLGGNQGITHEGLKAVSGMSQLEVLDLSGTRVHDEGLRHLRGLRMLRELDLSHAPVSDAAVDDIVALPALERIVLTFTGLTANGLSELRARRPKLEVDSREEQDSNVTFNLVRAGLWAQALEKLESVKLDCYPCKIAWMFGECHAGLGQLDRAEADYVKALQLVPTPDGTLVHVTSNTTTISRWQTDIWADLCAKPDLFDRVAQRRPDDPMRWVASAWRLILQGRWADAAEDYRRAVECSKDDSFDSQYAQAQLAAGDVRGQRSFVKKKLSATELQRELTIDPRDDEEWYRAVKFWLYSPQGTIRLPGLLKWLTNEVTELRRAGLGPLVIYRLEGYQDVLDCGMPDSRHNWKCCGRLWFARAMAHQRLGHAQQARQCYARAVRWVERIGEFADRRHDVRLAYIVLEAEVLRREAESLIFASASARP